MEDPKQELLNILNRFYVNNRCTREDTSLLVKNYMIDEFREFTVYYVIRDSAEYMIAGLFSDIDGIKVIEYNSFGEQEECKPEEEQAVIQ
jgi:hypothetical protein